MSAVGILLPTQPQCDDVACYNFKYLKLSESNMKFIALLFLPLLSLGQTKLDKTISLLNGKVEILAPNELFNMSDEMWKLKYHNLPKPALVLTDENGEINLLVDLTQQPAVENQIAAYKD